MRFYLDDRSHAVRPDRALAMRRAAGTALACAIGTVEADVVRLARQSSGSRRGLVLCAGRPGLTVHGVDTTAAA